MLSVLEDNHDEDGIWVGMVSFDSIDWEKIFKFYREESFLQYANHTMGSVKQLPCKHLIELQVQYYNTILEKQKELLFDGRWDKGTW